MIRKLIIKTYKKRLDLSCLSCNRKHKQVFQKSSVLYFLPNKNIICYQKPIIEPIFVAIYDIATKFTSIDFFENNIFAKFP